MTKAELIAKARIHEAMARLGSGETTCTLTWTGNAEPIVFNREKSKRHRALARQLREQAKRLK